MARVVPSGSEVSEALQMAEKMASYSLPVLQLAKECVNASQEMSLAEGLRLKS